MISQLLATIMMALGVASGTKATGNTFYDAEKPQPKKVLEQYEEERTFTIAGEWHDNGYATENRKFYLNDYNASTPLSATMMFDNMIIYNSTYVFENPEPDGTRYDTGILGIYKITNLYAGASQFDLNFWVSTGSINLYGSYAWNYYISIDTNLDAAIDQTMTAGSGTTIWNIVNTANKTLLNGNSGWKSDSNPTFECQSNSITLNENATLYVILHFYWITNYATTTDTLLTSMTFRGNYNNPYISMEVVDIPGIMFEVLSMPFSFISTAFNLTIFPNTPYTVNFANLFMVILAAFILMWLIKKVFH